MIENHITKSELDKKIIQLFEYRLFPELIRLGQPSEKEFNGCWQNLLSLQASIYYLDAHLEAHWNTDSQVLEWHWNHIIQHLESFGIEQFESQKYLNHIKKYEKHELELRKGKMPMRLDMEYFYYYKSCDVKLLRRLIYETFNLSSLCGSLAEWRYYDLITEVNDDVDDLMEDLDFYNGNRFLLSILTKGKLNTKNEFDVFIHNIKSKAEERVKQARGKYKDYIYEMTIQRVGETLLHMDKRLQELNLDELHNSKIGKVVFVNQ
jgi:hypothetical protein